MAAHTTRLLILPPSTPAAFLTHVLEARQPPSTVLICASRPAFLQAAVAELHHSSSSSSDPPDVLRATLGRVAIARHVHTAFIPSVTHLRAYLSVFPFHKNEQQQQQQQQHTLLVYGFLDVHRDAGEAWSAQGIGCSAACVVEAAARAGLTAVVLMEPTSWECVGGAGAGAGDDDDDGLPQQEEKEKERWAVYEEQIPVLGTTAGIREDGTWGVPCTSARAILERWFTFNVSWDNQVEI
ncbi:hypothetical protein V2A60_001567 [Cordyceps javanica]|uniref:Uncharacterized protein n=1 Tax=Cordyceps javanica TaxID=43265 RepID=A0A545WCG3_9HYPO|nr:hypothetical protein IF1G_00419 [Cordyceps javanica]TQW11670.1 hypothetical protein IF2G_00401 [Cordyceps javanica]